MVNDPSDWIPFIYYFLYGKLETRCKICLESAGLYDVYIICAVVYLSPSSRGFILCFIIMKEANRKQSIGSSNELPLDWLRQVNSCKPAIRQACKFSSLTVVWNRLSA